jgi:hypothetical protein
MSLQFTRNANVYVQLTDAAGTHVQAWKLSVLDGFSFSQSINSSEITINEAGVISRRARLLFNDSLAPVEWSMSTYARPITTDESPSPNECHAPEEVLWAMMLGADTYTNGVYSNSVIGASTSPDAACNALATGAAPSNTFDFSASNVSSLSDRWNLFFSFEDVGNTQVYKLESSVVNSASIDFDIDGIATIAWSGFGKALTDVGTSLPGDLSSPIQDGISETTNFIRNRISTVDLEWSQASHSPNPDAYELVLTGGNFTVENNISYLTPEELGIVNKPLANITGARTITGSMSCYLDNDQANSKSGELFADLVSDSTTVRNVFNMAIHIGGVTAGTPRLDLDLPTAHLEIPSINVEDLLTLEIAFHGQVASGNVDNTNEATIIYKS